MLGGVNDAAEDARRDKFDCPGAADRVKVEFDSVESRELPYKESSAEMIEEFRRFW